MRYESVTFFTFIRLLWAFHPGPWTQSMPVTSQVKFGQKMRLCCTSKGSFLHDACEYRPRHWRPRSLAPA